MNNVLEVKNLNITFDTYAGKVKAIRGVSFNLKKEKRSQLLVSLVQGNQ